MKLTEDYAINHLHCDTTEEIDGSTYAYDSCDSDCHMEHPDQNSDALVDYSTTDIYSYFPAYRIGDDFEPETDDRHMSIKMYKVCYPSTQEYAILYSAFCNGKLDEMPERFEDWDACYDVKKPWVEDL